MSTDAPLGTFEEHVMVALVRLVTGGAADVSGMAIRAELAAVTGRDVSVGAVYATLDRLESKRLLASRRSTVEGLSRRVFAVTAAGVAALEHSRSMREQLWRGIDLRRIRYA